MRWILRFSSRLKRFEYQGQIQEFLRQRVHFIDPSHGIPQVGFVQSRVKIIQG